VDKNDNNLMKKVHFHIFHFQFNFFHEIVVVFVHLTF
jgi:hypothetical protein